METNYETLVHLKATVLANINPDGQEAARRGWGTDYTVPATPGGHICLFKPVDLHRVQGTIHEDGTVNFANLISKDCTDFAWVGGLYFTHQLWVAAHYSKMIGDACPASQRRTMELHVPLSHFKEVGLLEMKFDDGVGKRLVFHSRRKEVYPKDIARVRKDLGVLHGPIAVTHYRSFSKMRSPDDITAKHMLFQEDEYGTNCAKQHVWLRDGAIEALRVAVEGKVYLRKPEQGFALIPKPWKDKSVE